VEINLKDWSITEVMVCYLNCVLHETGKGERAVLHSRMVGWDCKTVARF